MTTAAALVPDNQKLTPQTQVDPLSKEIDKAKKLGIILIALGFVLAAATAIIGYKFHAYQPLSQDYHYLGLSIIGIGGGAMSLIILYKGANSLKEAYFKARQKEFEDVYEMYIEEDTVKGIQEACKCYPNHFKKGYVTMESLEAMILRPGFSTSDDASIFGNAVKALFNTSFTVVKDNFENYFVSIHIPQANETNE